MSERATLDEAILALRAMRGDASHASRTLERIGSTLERPSPVQRAVFIARVPARHYSALARPGARSDNVQVAAVVALGLLLATSSYAAFFGVPASLRTWLDSDSVARPSAMPHQDAPLPAPPTVPSEDLAPAPATARTVAEPSGPVEARRTVLEQHEVRTRSERAISSQPGPRAAVTTLDLAVPSSDEPNLASTVEREQLYADAHRLHFVIRDYSAALYAWERYLRVAGDALLAVDARYNRALCLVRIGEHAAARSALTAIARGEAGAYRQREARALLKVLR
jgi:hypothetical protein